MRVRTVEHLPLLRHIAGLIALTCSGISLAQLSPGGHTGAINTPTADVLALGTVAVSLTNNNPELQRAHPGVGYFGSTALGFGALPGMELTSRLAYEGDLNCSQFSANCASSLRDVSINGKYQFPTQGPLNSRFAVGFNDYGGAATHFRQAYGVATARWNFLEWSVGYASVGSANTLLNGAFKSGTLHLSDYLQLKWEDEGIRQRTGAGWRFPMSRTWALTGTVSRQTAGPADFQKPQISMGLQWLLDPHPSTSSTVPDRRLTAPLISAQPSDAAPTLASAPLVSTPAENPRSASEPNTHSIARHWARHGFRDLQIDRPAPHTLRIRAEPVGWRKHRTDALGAALGTWLRSAGADEDRLELTLTYLRQPVLVLTTTRACALAFMQGATLCNARPSLEFQSPHGTDATSSEPLHDSHSSAFHPELEIGLATAYTVGTEYGLADYSLGVDMGWQIPLAKGLLWQGNAVTPLSHSDDFNPPYGYWQASRVRSGVDTSLLSYQTPLARQLWVQLSSGQIATSSHGQQLNLSWLNDSGRVRVTGIQGRYREDDQPTNRHPQLLSARYSVMPGLWSLDVTRGQFYGGDRGTRVMSDHWFGDHRLTFYVRESASPDQISMPRTRFAGFEFTIPLGPKQSYFMGPFSIRGRDHFPIGLSSKVGSNNNNLTPGYGLVPMLRHGLNDILDQDRAGHAHLLTQLHRVRAVMREVFEE